MYAALQLIASFTAGSLLGLVYFWGLWATLNTLVRARFPALRMLASQLLRLGLVLVLFYLIARYQGWQHLLAATVGFTLVRIIIQRLRPYNVNKAS